MSILNNYKLNTLYDDVTELSIVYPKSMHRPKRKLPDPKNVPNLKILRLNHITLDYIPLYPNLEELDFQHVTVINKCTRSIY
jgi:hypothetical protein